MKIHKEFLKSEKELKYSVVSDLIFTFFPILIMLVLSILKGNLNDWLNRTDWSYISLILWGQTIAKFLSGITTNQNKRKVYFINFIFIILILFGFFPSALFLIMLEMGATHKLLPYLQLAWLILGIIAYLIWGLVGYILSENSLIHESDFINEL